MKYLLGVDGGGSSTEFALADTKGNILFSVFSGSTSHKSVGKEAALANICAGLRKLEEKGIGLSEIVYGVWGLSGCDTPEDRAGFEDMLHSAGLGENHTVVNDALLAFRARAEAPGMVLIAGTGSIVMGFGKDGAVYRLGGWHYAFSDLGSGYWLGASLLRETALWLDGCREWDPVFDAVCAGRTPEETLNAFSNLKDGDEIGAFARLVLETEDSPLCAILKAQAAAYLCGYGKAMSDKLGQAGSIVLSGGLFRNDGFRAMVTAKLGENAIWKDVSPAVGGIRMAMDIYKGQRRENHGNGND